EVQLRSAADGKLLASVPVGIWPDSLAFSPSGEFLVVANEGEAYVKDGTGYRSGEGSISVIDLRAGLDQAVQHKVELPDLAQVSGTVQDAHKRLVERMIDGEELKVPFGSSPEHIEPEYVTLSRDGSKA